MAFNIKHSFYLLILSSLSIGIFARLDNEGIVGGDDAEEGQFPYQVLLRKSGKTACGGSIIGERFIVTAGHCVVNRKNKLIDVSFEVVAGATNLVSETEHPVVVDVEQVFALKEFDPSNVYRRITGDIAVLKLRKDLGISENPNLDTIKLPENDETYEGVQGVISGFGLNKVDIEMDPANYLPREANGVFYGMMRFAKVNVLSNAECGKYYYQPPDEKQICASVVQRDPKKPEGACSGDSGGPLVYENTLIGIISSSPMGCRENHKPAVYTRVSKYVNFLHKVINGQTDETIRSTTLPLSD